MLQAPCLMANTIFRCLVTELNLYTTIYPVKYPMIYLSFPLRKDWLIPSPSLKDPPRVTLATYDWGCFMCTGEEIPTCISYKSMKIPSFHAQIPILIMNNYLKHIFLLVKKSPSNPKIKSTNSDWGVWKNIPILHPY